MSERAYAEHAGLSRGAVQKARKNGRLVLFADGSINAAASDARRGAMTDPDQQMRSRGASVSGDSGVSGPGDSTSYLKARTALTVYQAQERQLSIQRKKGVLVDRARAETLVFRLARQERDTWVTWPTRVAALMAAQLSAEMEKASGAPVLIETAILQRVLETHVREQLDALADLRVSLS
jgi:phage terminase Nu1 subunit (DNA packaging protein)